MAALAVIQVAGFTGDEVGCGISGYLAIDIAMLEIGIRVAFFAAIVIGGRDIVGAFAGFPESCIRELDLFDARRQAADLFVIAVHNDDAIHLAEIGVINIRFVFGIQFDQRAGGHTAGFIIS